MSSGRLLEVPPAWEDHERPMIPGSPARLSHGRLRSVAYVVVGIFVGLVGGLGNGLVTANLSAIQSQLGLTPVEAAWLPAAYVMVNVTANLLVFKARQQYGIRVFAELGLGLYALLALLHVVVQGYPLAILVRAMSGFAGATTTSLAVLYLMQGMPPKRIATAFVLGMGISFLGVPLAWAISPSIVDARPWPVLYSLEAGLALCAFAAVVMLKLPRGLRIHVFEPLDFLSFALVAPAVALLCAVLAQGVNLWWFNEPMLAYGLIAALVLLTLAGLLEMHRSKPLLQLRWLLQPYTMMFAGGALMMRFMIAEQNYGAVGLLRSLGMTPELLQTLYGVIFLGMLLGLLVSAFTIDDSTVPAQLLGTFVLIGIAGFLDWHATSQSRPHDFFLSQFLVGFSASLLMGPLLAAGMKQVFMRGMDHFMTFVILFAVTQSMGSLLGPALLGTLQVERTQIHVQAISADTHLANPLVVQRLAQLQRPTSAMLTDGARRAAQSQSDLLQSIRREASVRAYNDVFWLISTIALAVILGLFFKAVWTRKLRPRLIPG